MKGTPNAPQCGFSAATVNLFKSFNVPFATRDVIASNDLRQTVPQFSNWPTFPQIFIGGQLIGGSDIIHELKDNGELDQLLKDAFENK